jgi:hypothetical protein
MICCAYKERKRRRTFRYKLESQRQKNNHKKINNNFANEAPTRSFGPALITRNFEYNWLYWIAPIIGGIIAAGVYKGLHKDTDFPSAAEDEQVKQG